MIFFSCNSRFEKNEIFIYLCFSFIIRQQRDEIQRKKEKLESMLKGKKSQSAVRPESPNSRRRRSLKRTTVPTRRLSSSRNSMEVCMDIRDIDLLYVGLKSLKHVFDFNLKNSQN